MLDSWQTFLSGLVLGFSIAAPPGPVNATAALQVARSSWISGWSVELGATTADGIFFLLTYYGLTQLVASTQLRDVLFLAGGLLMLYLGVSILRGARSTGAGAGMTRKRGGRYPYVIGLSIALTNPFQLAWWVTVGVGMVATFGASIVSGFFSGILMWTVVFTLVLRVGISRYGRAFPYVAYASGAVLLAFALWFLYLATVSLLP